MKTLDKWPYWQNLKILCKSLITSLYSLINYEGVTPDSIEEITHLKELCYFSLKHLSFMCECNEFFGIFAESKKP